MIEIFLSNSYSFVWSYRWVKLYLIWIMHYANQQIAIETSRDKVWIEKRVYNLCRWRLEDSFVVSTGDDVFFSIVITNQTINIRNWYDCTYAWSSHISRAFFTTHIWVTLWNRIWISMTKIHLKNDSMLQK